MVHESSNRVSDALKSLAESYLSPDQDEDGEGADKRRDDVHDILKYIVEGYACRPHSFTKSNK